MNSNNHKWTGSTSHLNTSQSEQSATRKNNAKPMFHIHFYDFISVAFCWLITPYTSHVMFSFRFRLSSLKSMEGIWFIFFFSFLFSSFYRHMYPYWYTSASGHECCFGIAHQLYGFPRQTLYVTFTKIPFNVDFNGSSVARNGSSDSHQHRVKYNNGIVSLLGLLLL